MTLFLYNNLTKQKEHFTPLKENTVSVYVCGPTVYDFAHLGNARAAVSFDILYRLLKELYPTVTYVSNVTDVDDKINDAAKKNNESIFSLTSRTLKAFEEDMETLNVLAPTHRPKATEHIKEMIDMIQTLITKGFAYEKDGHVLFDVARFEDYGKLSKRQLDELIAGARVEVAPYKKSPMDFVLWKPSDAETPGWQSPWGYGRPGWHIECSAMSAHYLGETFDIHAGGIDLIFPHHENEIAQSRCAHGTSLMSRYWLHNGHLTVQNEKMSKSLGNFVTVRQLSEHYPGETIRLSLLLSHYRQPLNWSEESLTQSQNILDRLYRALENYESVDASPQPCPQVLDSLCQDMNAPEALMHLQNLASALNKETDLSKANSMAATLIKSGQLLGLLYNKPSQWIKGHHKKNNALQGIDIDNLILERNNARMQKDFQKADAIRHQLDEMGILLEDKNGVTTWRYKN